MTAGDARLDACVDCLGCPDCGPSATKRTVEAIAHRLGKVSEGPWTAWDRGIGYEVHNTHGEPINDRCRETFSRGDAEFIAMAPGDVHFLLAELREAREALAAVESVHYEGIAYADDVAEGSDEPVPDDYEHHFCQEDGEDWPCATMAAVAAAKGDGEDA